ncbi:MAG: VWA domain-containing protein, partial [Candidatus Woesearchaeota archaeon]
MTRKQVVAFDRSQVEIEELSKAEEQQGKLASDFDQKLMHLVLENDTETVKDGKLVSAAINQGFSSFTPDLFFEKLVQQYSMAKQLYGETLIRLIMGYSPNYIKKNISIPEFRRELKNKAQETFENLKNKGHIDRDGNFTEKGIGLSAIIMYKDELERMLAKGLIGTVQSKRKAVYGDKNDSRGYRKGDRYRDIELKGSIKKALRRGHLTLQIEDLQVVERKSKGSIEIIYALDASGSMKGKKIEMAKRAGIALAYTAISQKDRVGLIVFGTQVKEEIRPTNNFPYITARIAGITASAETNITGTIQKSTGLFSTGSHTKHLILLTDCLPTIGKEPEKETIESAAYASSRGITISVVGIGLDKQGTELATRIAEIGKGKLHIAEKPDELDVVMLR